MAKKFEEEVAGGLPGWMGTYGDLVTLLLCFFILLFSMSSVDVSKYKAAMSSFADNIGIMPGGLALTGGELVTNGVSQLAEIEVVLANQNPTTDDSEKKELEEKEAAEASQSSDSSTQSDSNDVSQMNAAELQSKSGQIAQEIQAYLSKEGIESEVMLSFNSNYVKMTLSGEALFDVGKATLKPESMIILTTIYEMIAQQELSAYKIQVEGHTDNWDINTAQFPNNWYLSSARAIAVGDVFISQFGFDPKMVACTGYGEYNPIATNETPEGRAKNRRVEIKLIIETEEVVPENVLQKNQ